MVKRQEDNIFLVLFIVLIIIISFGVGYLTKSNSQNNQIIIKNPVSANQTKTTSTTNTPLILPKNKVFVASKNSDKYHIPDCVWAKKIKEENKIKFSSEAKAKNAGYKPCSCVLKQK